MTIDGRLARIDAAIAEVHARARRYREIGRAEPRASRLAKDPPPLPPHPSPPSPSPPTPPSFPRDLSAATAAFVVASARRARGESPPEPEEGEDGDRDKPKKSPPDPEHGDDDDQKNAAPGDLILRAIKRRQEDK